MQQRVRRAVYTDCGHKIVLYNWAMSDERKFKNVEGFKPHGRAKWRAELPALTADDCFIELTLSGGAVMATTFTGYRLELDASTGATLSSARITS